MNLRIITKKYAADQEIGFFAKSISMSNGCVTAMPTAWELKKFFLDVKLQVHFNYIVAAFLEW